MKKGTIKELILSYSKDKYYFHIDDLKKYLSRRRVKFKNNSLKQNLYFLKKNEQIYEAGRGWYSTIKNTFVLDTKSIEKIVSLIYKKFPFIEFSCWSTEQLKIFYHHLPSQFVTFIYADKDYLPSLKDFLTDNNYNVFLNPYKSEVDKYVELKGKTIILRAFVLPRKAEKESGASIEKILVDLFMETKKINLMDSEEYKRIFSNIVLNSRINMAELLDYAERRKIKEKIQNTITSSLYTNATF